MLTKNQNIDSMILRIKAITKNRFSLSDDDVELLNAVVVQLEELKHKQNQDSHATLIVALKIVMMFAKVFFSDCQE